MNTLAITPKTPVKEIPSEPPAKVTFVGVFADDACGREVVELHRHLGERLGSDWVLNCSWWQFDSLPESFAEAARVGTEAEIIMVATPDRRLPAVVEAWLDQTLSQSERDERALIALLGNSSGCPQARSDLDEHLKTLAAQAGMTFFAHWFELPSSGAASFREDLTERARVITRTLEEVLTHPLAPPRWGIIEENTEVRAKRERSDS